MENNILLSIIIPVYNTEGYIERCLESIANQQVNNYEIVIINDGSTDGSDKIIKTFIISHPQIKFKYYNQKNKGLSSARNKGIELAEGTYLHFIDSDDYLVNNNYKFVYEIISSDMKPDIIEIGFNIIRNNTIVKRVLPVKTKGEGGIDYLIQSLENDYAWYPWKYIIKRSYMLSYNFMFPVGTKYEDVYLIPRILHKVERIKTVEKECYNYILGRPGAITNGINIKCEIDKINVAAANISFFEKNENNKSNECKKMLQNNFSHLYFSALIPLYAVKNDERKELYNVLKRNKKIARYTSTGPQKILKILLFILGIKGTAFLLYIRMVLKNGFKFV